MTSIVPSRAVYESDLPFSLVRCMFWEKISGKKVGTGQFVLTTISAVNWWQGSLPSYYRLAPGKLGSLLDFVLKLCRGWGMAAKRQQTIFKNKPFRHLFSMLGKSQTPPPHHQGALAAAVPVSLRSTGVKGQAHLWLGRVGIQNNLQSFGSVGQVSCKLWACS